MTQIERLSRFGQVDLGNGVRIIETYTDQGYTGRFRALTGANGDIAVDLTARTPRGAIEQARRLLTCFEVPQGWLEVPAD